MRRAKTPKKEGPASEFAAEVATRIREMMALRGLSQKELWRRSGVPTAQIWNIIHANAAHPNLTMVRNLAVALDVSIDYLAGMYDGDRTRFLKEGKYQAPIYQENFPPILDLQNRPQNARRGRKAKRRELR